MGRSVAPTFRGDARVLLSDPQGRAPRDVRQLTCIRCCENQLAISGPVGGDAFRTYGRDRISAFPTRRSYDFSPISSILAGASLDVEVVSVSGCWGIDDTCRGGEEPGVERRHVRWRRQRNLKGILTNRGSTGCANRILYSLRWRKEARFDNCCSGLLRKNAPHRIHTLDFAGSRCALRICK